MPEAAIDEHSYPPSRKNDISPAAKTWDWLVVDAKSKAEAMKRPPED